MDEYNRLRLDYYGLFWVATITGNERVDFVPPIRAYGFNEHHARCRVVRKVKRAFDTPREVKIER